MKKLKISYALKITTIYALIGSGWVLFSDHIVEKLFSDSAQISAAQTYKGWSYVAITASFLFILLKKNQFTKKTAEHTEKLYRTLVERLPAVVFMDKFNEIQTTQYISPRMKDLLGYTPEEWMASDNIWEDSLHPEDKERVIAEDIRTNETGSPFNIEYRMRHRDGHYIWIKENASIVRDDDGAALFWQGILSDITLQKETEESTQKHLKELIILHAVAQAESTAENTDDLIQRITVIIGSTLYPYNCGVLLLNETRDELVPHYSYRGVNEEKRVHTPLTIGIAGKVAATGRSVLLGDVSQETAYYEVTSGIKSELCVPIIDELKTIGVINVESKEPNAFTRNDERLLNTIAGGMINFIKRIRLLELEQKRRHEAEMVRLATTALTNLLDIPSLYDAILDWLYKITPYDSASILEIEENGIRLTAARGIPNLKKVLGSVFPKDNTLCKIMNETGKPLIIADCQKDSRYKKWAGVDYTRGWIGVPLIARGQVIGYISMDSHTPNTFTESDATITQTFAHQAATSLENIRHLTETQQRLAELEIISRVSFSLRAAHDTQEMSPILLNEIKSSMDTDSVAIWLYNNEKDELQTMAASGQFSNFKKSKFKPNEGLIGKVYSSGISHVSDEFFDDPAIVSNGRLSSQDESESQPLLKRQDDQNEKSTYIYGYITTIPQELNFFGKNWGGIIVPIRTTSNTIGALAVALRTPRKIEINHIRLVTTLAEIAGNAIYRSNLYERGEDQISQLTILRDIDTAIVSSLDLGITLNILVENMLAKMNVDAAAILVLNPDNQMLEYRAIGGFANRELLRAPLGIGDDLTGSILLSRQTQYISDIKTESNSRLKTLLSKENFTSYYAVPLIGKGAAKGIIESYFRSPFSPTASWVDFMNALAGQAIIAIDNAQLFQNLQRSNQELSLAYDTTLEGWGKALELRDKETEGHTRRVTNLTIELALQMGIPETELMHIRRGALLHDIGKMGVPDRILRKAGKLTKKEKVEMRKHTQYAYDLLYPINYLHPAIDIAYCHHEWWDGSGYPRGLKGEEIPLSARIFAVIDVWDALLSDRPYRMAWTDKKTMKYIKDLSGKQFDPHVVETFCRMIENIQPLNNQLEKNKKMR